MIEDSSKTESFLRVPSWHLAPLKQPTVILVTGYDTTYSCSLGVTYEHINRVQRVFVRRDFFGNVIDLGGNIAAENFSIAASINPESSLTYPSR